MAALPLIAAGASIVGAGISIYGQVKANADQAEAERANAAFYQEQAEFARQATNREVSLYTEQASQFTGNLIGQIAKGGVTQSGSALQLLADTRLKQINETDAIVEDGRMKTREALLKAGASIGNADRLSDFGNNFLPAFGTVLTVGSDVGMKLARNR